MRVLFFSPYATWHYHGVLEITWAHALAQRGAEVRFVTCDAQFPACDVWREGLNPRHALSCVDCQQRTASLHRDMGMPYTWLGSYVPRPARAAIRDWVEALERDELLGAHWKGRPVGQWARSSAFYQFRMSRFDLDQPRVAAGVRAHVEGTAIAVEGLEALLDEWRPDLVVLLNGRFFAHQTAFALARERGIRVVTHERGLLKGTLRFADDARIHDLGLYETLWERWHDVPLEESELAWTRAVLADRRAGRNLPWESYSPPPQDEAEVRRRLGLGDRPLVVMFSSSDDESAAFDDRREGAFPDSLEWLNATVALARELPEHDLVIRLHPNLTRNGTNRQTLERIQRLRGELPPNAHVVMPDDDVSSYTLADLASAGLFYFSTLGLEMATRGQPVVAVARGWYGHCDFVRRVERPADYAGAVRAALAAGPDPEVARRAWRFAHALYRELSIPFPLVVESPRHHGQPQFRDTAQLAPGAEPNLDRICRFLLGQEPLLSSPEPHHRQRSEEAEDRFLAAHLPHLGAGLPASPSPSPSPEQVSP